jgi:hypothetical protein
VTTPMCTRPEHKGMPVIECEFVQLTRSRRPAPVCMCGHLKAVHEHYRPGFDCGKCDCGHYETARGRRRQAVAVWAAVIVGYAAFWAAVWFGVRAVIGGH